jgi:hypothetical protein
VAVTELEASEAGEVPYAFVAVTVIDVTAPEPKPVIVNGEDAPVTVCPVLAVAVKDVAAYGPAGVNVTVIAPFPYGRFVPTSVAVPIVGAYGDKKSFDD